MSIDDDVDAGGDERVGALVAVGARADGGADAEAALLVLDGERVAIGLEDVLDRDEPDELAALDDEELLDAVLVEELLAPRRRDAGRDGDELLRHERADGLIEVLLEADVARREDADRALALDDGHAGDVVLAHDAERLAQRLARAAR